MSTASWRVTSSCCAEADTIAERTRQRNAIKQRGLEQFNTAVIPLRAVFNRGKTLSMTSEVMGGQRASQMVPSLNATHCFAIIGLPLVRRVWLHRREKSFRCAFPAGQHPAPFRRL